MGRMLETLKQGEAHRSNLAAKPIAAPASPTQGDCVVEWTLAEDEAPYIEVGAPGKKVLVSPGLLKHPPQEKLQPPHAPLEKPRLPVVNLTEPKPMAVAFEAWPTAPQIVAPEVVTYHHPEDPASKEYAALLEKMLAGQKADSATTLLLAGVRPRVGATTVLLNLAVVAAAAKKRVVVVDANGAKPGLASLFGHAPIAGIQEVVEGKLALEQAVHKTPIAGLSLLPASSQGRTAGPLPGEAMVWLLGWLRERFDLILVDAPPMLESVPLAPLVDGLFLVLPQGASATIEKGFAQTVALAGGRLRGLIHTRFDA
jgi:Mrp family chromosome partitioning ATPase